MKARLLKPHFLNGCEYPAGTIFEVPPRRLANWVAAGWAEEVDERGEPVRPRGGPGPIPVPQTKDGNP